FCSDGEVCAMTSEACVDNEDCCSNLCTTEQCEADSVGCAPIGELCTTDGNCCSGKCTDIDGTLRCILVSICFGEGDLCDEDADCCSGVCGDNGHCPQLSECQTVGEPCTGFHECCSGVCADPGTGGLVCQFPSGCRSIGEVCLVNEDCCGFLCQAVQDTGLNRCEKPANPGCLPSGEVCGGSAYGASNNCCPPGIDGGSQLCLETVIGITRCYGEGTHDDCIVDGETCTFGDECCSGFCLPDENGDLTCGTECVPLDGVCTTHADCCDNMICEDGTCQENTYGCVQIGGVCEVNDDCCSDLCSNGTCTVG
ncbi:MAG: hypothetical protein JRJ87_18170, partial [Deltaproteobacteria bacterium]|nr:hypothetical protein [Deltaproteobacteria bacterium]